MTSHSRRFPIALATFLLALALVATAHAQQTTYSALLSSAAANPKTFARREDLMLAYLALGASTPTAVTSAINEQRTDVQMGNSGPYASTTLTENNGYADILSIALERGAVSEQSNNGVLTVSTTPYALYTGFGAADSVRNWERLRALRMVSLSATFGAAAINQNSDFEKFQSAEVKVSLAGNRSPRDLYLSGAAHDQLAQLLTVSDTQFGATCGALLGSSPGTFIPAEASFGGWLDKQSGPVTTDQVSAALRDATDAIKLSGTQQQQLSQCSDAMTAQLQAGVSASQALASITAAYLAAIQANQLSVAALYTRDATISDFFTGKLLFGSNPNSTTSTNLNGSIDINKDSHGPVVAGTKPASLERIRDYGIEASLTRAQVGRRAADLTFSAKVDRNQGSNQTVLLSQARLDLRLRSGSKLPISMTYANKAVAGIEKGFHFSIGVGVLLDDYLAQNMP